MKRKNLKLDVPKEFKKGAVKLCSVAGCENPVGDGNRFLCDHHYKHGYSIESDTFKSDHHARKSACS